MEVELPRGGEGAAAHGVGGARPRRRRAARVRGGVRGGARLDLHAVFLRALESVELEDSEVNFVVYGYDKGGAEFEIGVAHVSLEAILHDEADHDGDLPVRAGGGGALARAAASQASDRSGGAPLDRSTRAALLKSPPSAPRQVANKNKTKVGVLTAKVTALKTLQLIAATEHVKLPPEGEREVREEPKDAKGYKKKRRRRRRRRRLRLRSGARMAPATRRVQTRSQPLSQETDAKKRSRLFSLGGSRKSGVAALPADGEEVLPEVTVKMTKLTLNADGQHLPGKPKDKVTGVVVEVDMLDSEKTPHRTPAAKVGSRGLSTFALRQGLRRSAIEQAGEGVREGAGDEGGGGQRGAVCGVQPRQGRQRRGAGHRSVQPGVDREPWP